MNCSHVVVNALKPLMKTHGWKKSHHTWRKELDELVLVLNIQKALFSSEIYINWGVYIKNLDESLHCVRTRNPHEYHCPVRGRFDSEIGHENLEFNLKNQADTERKVQVIVDYMEREGLPFLEGIRKVTDLKKPALLRFVSSRPIQKYLKNL